MLEKVFNRAAQLRVLDVPLGKSFLYPVSYGLGAALVLKLKSLGVPPIAAGFIIAALLRKLSPVKRFLGDSGSEMLAVGVLAAGIDGQIQITPRILNFLGGKLGVIGSTSTPSGGTGTALVGATPGPASGAKLGAPRAGSAENKIAAAAGEATAPVLSGLERKIVSINSA